MNVAIIGLGNLGTAIAYIAAKNGHSVIGWEFNAAVIADIALHQNQRFLPNIILPNSITASADIDAVFNNADIVFITLPSRYFRSVLTSYASQVDSKIPLVNMAKGIDAESGQTAFHILEELFPHNPKAMLAGPSLANEFVNGVLTAVVAATSNLALFDLIARVLDNDRFAVSYSSDITGVELGGMLKNIYALGLGLLENREDIGLNFKGAYLTQAIKEMQNYGAAKGARQDSFVSFSGLGDLIATSLSVQSHNFTLGRLLASGLNLTEIERRMGSLPEGLNTLKVVVSEARQKKLSIPLAILILACIEKEITPDELLTQFAAVFRRGEN